MGVMVVGLGPEVHCIHVWMAVVKYCGWWKRMWMKGGGGNISALIDVEGVDHLACLDRDEVTMVRS